MRNILIGTAARDSQLGGVVRPIEPLRYDDLVLSVLLLIIGVPRAVAALVYDNSIGVEGTLSMICVVLGLAILLYRNLAPRNAAQR